MKIIWNIPAKFNLTTKMYVNRNAIKSCIWVTSCLPSTVISYDGRWQTGSNPDATFNCISIYDS